MSNETLTITLTDRPPVRITKAEWPIIARATGDSWHGGLDPARHDQASFHGELDEFRLTVRQHADGRAVVYGVVDAGANTRSEDWRGGELLPAGADIPAAIRRVGQDGHIPDAVIRECVANLPAETI